uniref:Hydrolase n=1 Tax=uncultured Helicobacter sp. TaxID=175537 RepID=A0A650ELA5_9HELI|nr:hypothetical protein Helico5904_0180 [uncultured Helicobacter sp.]
MILKKILNLFLIFFLTSCSSKIIQTTQIKDLQTLPQDASFYIDSQQEKATAKVAAKDLQALQKDYLEKFYSVWKQKPNPKTAEIFWIKPSLLSSPGFGEHLQPNSKEYTKNILDTMQIERYPSLNKKAIITRTTNVRAVPTQKPMYNKVDGYPFDRWQNSLIFAGTPVLVTHISTSKRWVHIQSGFVYGWVEANDIGYITDSQIKALLNKTQYITPIQDIVSVVDSKGRYVLDARIGQIFPKAQISKPDARRIYFYAYMRNPDGSVKQEILSAPKDTFQRFPLPTQPRLIAQTINTMIGQRYGWGGLGENRDCSAFIRDIFTQYGIYLPRNSKAQVSYGNNSIDLKALSSKEKEAFIIANATPYMTLLWQQGHIMLYIGQYQGKALIAHSAWSVITGKKYENMLGGVVITTLHTGEERNGLFAHSDLLIDKINAMSDLSILAQNIIDKSKK